MWIIILKMIQRIINETKLDNMKKRYYKTHFSYYYLK